MYRTVCFVVSSVAIVATASVAQTAVATDAGAASQGTQPVAYAMPPEVRGYRLTDSLLLGPKAGTQYTYARGRDQLNVFVAPYQTSDRLNSREDTTTYVTDDVAQYYQTLELANRQGLLDNFRVLHRGEDDLHTGGRVIRASSVWAQLRRRTVAGLLYTYYATYALPSSSVRVRAELSNEVARNDEVPTFTKQLIASMLQGR